MKKPTTLPARDAGTLYDVMNGQQRYALVEAGEIKTMGYYADTPDGDWLPVVHCDSGPFDLAVHWRLAPVYSIESDRVVCTYPVVAKSLEYA